MQSTQSAHGVDERIHGAYDRWLEFFPLPAHGTAVALLLPYRDEFGGAGGCVHRGVIAAFAEVAGTAALRHRVHGVITVDAFHILYVGVASAGNELYAQAHVVESRAYVEIRTNDDRALIARATLMAAMPIVETTVPDQHRQPLYPI